ncbi:glycine betaine ABC transporter substrate-binding protein [Kocuria atrinae]|uniref:glycine betaine ABC transporter substrate-binding protein n=1 Tax=Kocuria atrinae TaxID=592377 RepID=UPI0002D7E174|nr:glycine betaine ABC transporter substrate-binding protein [Kocuria atrinae]
MTSAEHRSSDALIYGRIDESFHQVAAALVEEVLLRLGHTVDVVEGPHPEMYPQLAAGDMDLFADAWLPGGHEVYWDQVKDTAVEAPCSTRAACSTGPFRPTSRRMWSPRSRTWQSPRWPSG